VRTYSGYDQARCLMGYCPQFDSFFETLTVRQHLEFYAAIKGIKKEYRKELIDR
jgi:ATP-binding cassette subfamily A (ABC1) protein 3